MSLLRSLAANMAAIVSGKALTAVAGLMTIMVLTRYLGPREFGYYRTVLTYCAFAAVLADCGLYMINLREMSRAGVEGAGKVAGNALALRFVSTGGMLIAAAAFAWATPYDWTVKVGVLIGAAIYTCLQASDFLISIFQSVLKQGRNAVAEVIGAVTTLAAVWILALTTRASALPMLGATLLGAALAMGISWRLAGRLVSGGPMGQPFRLRFDFGVWRQFLVAGLPIAGAQILGMAMLRGDALLLTLYQPPTDVGLYGVPSKLFELATSIPYQFAGLMMPTLTAGARSSPQEFRQALRNAVDAGALYGVGVILALSLFAPQILTLMAGADFAAGAPALAIIAFAIALAGMTHILRFALVACERPRFVLISDSIACVCAFIAYFALIPRYSFVGAALGTVVAEVTALICMLVALKRAGRPLPSVVNPLKAMFSGALAVGAMILLVRSFELPWLVTLAAGGGVYFGGLALTRAIPRELVLTVLKRRRVAYQGSA
jgi:O-antigen/teichoic acid export membrane protein